VDSFNTLLEDEGIVIFQIPRKSRVPKMQIMKSNRTKQNFSEENDLSYQKKWNIKVYPAFPFRYFQSSSLSKLSANLIS
jgi:hypothetical protein